MPTSRLPVVIDNGSWEEIYARGLGGEKPFYNGAIKDKSSRNSKFVSNRKAATVESLFAGPHYRRTV